MDNYLEILEESLRKKIQVLEKIQAYNEQQRLAFEGDSVELSQFDAAIEEKGKLIEQINKLDEGFETLYNNVATELKDNKAKYTQQIKVLQDLVKQVTDMSMTVRAQEARNKALVEDFFSKERAGLRQERMHSKAAYEYYKKVSAMAYEQPRYYDSKN